MNWNLNFISEENFRKHVADTISKYGEKLEPIDVQKFNKNIVDPIKLVFDKTVYNSTWGQIIGNETFRQRDKSNNNDIGYFHQRVFQYIDNCHVPDNGAEGGWDVIYKNKDGIVLPDGDCVKTVYIEMKNKHNTMNSASASKTYIKMQHQLLEDDDCACFLVEAIAQRSQDIKWETTVDGKKVSHKRIRRVSLDKFYSLVTGEQDAFYKMCLILPDVIKEVVEKENLNIIPQDTVVRDLEKIALQLDIDSYDLSMAMAIYLLGFSSYNGFNSFFSYKHENYNCDQVKEPLKMIYEYLKK